MNTKPNEELRSKLTKLRIHWYKSVSGVDYELAEESVDEIMQLVQTEIAEAERRAREEQRVATTKFYERELNYYKAFQESVIKREQMKIEPIRFCAGCSEQLTEIEVSHGKGLDPEPTITGKIDPIVGEEVKVEKPYKITENEYQEKQSE